MRIVKALWMFYRRLIFPSAALAICLGFLMMKGMAAVGASFFAYIFLVPMFHFFIYEINHPKEYFFYHNMGLSKLHLWFNTIGWSLIVGLILIVV
ncbi:MAG TPA: hypothetical protein VKB19_06545 [Pedobacter sp.]|nr:hypothetical protein [Pedobacter sp.]